MPAPKTDNEIDLLGLLVNIVQFVKVNFWPLAILFIAGAVLGTLYFSNSKKVYESEMILSSTILTDSYGKVLFKNINKQIEETNSDAVSKQLNVPSEVANEIVSLKIKNIAESNEVKERDRFLITAEVLDQKVLPQLQTGIVHYLENNDFVKVRVEQNKKFLQQMLASIEKELKDMEELKAKISSGDFFQNAKGNIMFDPTTVNSKILELTDKKISYQNSFELSNSVQIIEGFTTFKNPSKPKLSASVLFGSLLGVFFVAVFLAFKGIRSLSKMANPEN